MGNNGGSSYGENETSMMMMMHPSPSTSEFPLPDDRNYGGNHVDVNDFRRDDVKLPTAVKRKDNYLKVYARKFGLNDRGCYVACVLGGLAFFFFVIIIAMGATWPGKSNFKNSKGPFINDATQFLTIFDPLPTPCVTLHHKKMTTPL